MIGRLITFAWVGLFVAYGIAVLPLLGWVIYRVFT